MAKVTLLKITQDLKLKTSCTTSYEGLFCCIGTILARYHFQCHNLHRFWWELVTVQTLNVPAFKT